MAENNMPGIKRSWSLLDFARSHGAPKLTQPREFVNTSTGETFTARSLAFEHPTEVETLADGSTRPKVIFVGFARKLGELTAQEIESQQENLQVVEYQTGTYGLCNKGSNSWESINLKI